MNGRSVYPVMSESKSSYQSISKTKTFTPPSNDRTFVFAQLSKNLENACIKARRYKLMAARLLVFLRTREFRDTGVEMRLSRSTAYPADLFGPLREGFDHLYQRRDFYRQTGVVLAGLIPETRVQYSLFEDTAKIERLSRVYHVVDMVAEKYGKYMLHHAASLPTKLQTQHEGERGDVPERKTDLFRGESRRQRLGLPVLRIKI
jgi:DNA polymerase-4/DNA polymerase V